MGDESKLKIWVMTNEFEPKIIGGLGVVATQLTRMLSKLGAKVTVLCSGNTDQLTIREANSLGRKNPTQNSSTDVRFLWSRN